MLPGVRPSICFASSPTASTRFVSLSMATTEGSRRRMPRPRTWTRVFAVPRSIPMSRENRPSRTRRIFMQTHTPKWDGLSLAHDYRALADASSGEHHLSQSRNGAEKRKDGPFGEGPWRAGGLSVVLLAEQGITGSEGRATGEAYAKGCPAHTHRNSRK